MEEFKKKNLIERMLTKQKELEQYYRDLRKYEYLTDAPIKTREYFDKQHKKLETIFGWELKLLSYNVKVHQDLRTPNLNVPKIYAVTHIGRYDIEASILTKGEQACFFWGDPGSLYKSPEKILTNKIGAIFADTGEDVREDCHIGQKSMVKHLLNGINVQIYPEGAFNVISNKVVMPIYDGTIKTALETGAPIVPTSIVKYGKDLYISYGKEILADSLNSNNIKEESRNLRDVLATLKWELIREYSGEKRFINQDEDMLYTLKRRELSSNAYQEFIDNVLDGTSKDYGLKEIEKTRYKDKHNPEPQEIESDLEEFIALNPSFFLASTERFENYINVLKNIDTILKNLEEYRSQESLKRKLTN